MKIASSIKILKFPDFTRILDKMLIFWSNIKFPDFSRFSRLRSNADEWIVRKILFISCWYNFNQKILKPSYYAYFVYFFLHFIFQCIILWEITVKWLQSPSSRLVAKCDDSNDVLISDSDIWLQVMCLAGIQSWSWSPELYFP